MEASKTPPIQKRSTASNISFEEGGASNVSKSCSRQPHQLSAFRGVRSRPPEEIVSPTKVETIPLLSPTMESELLKESWVFPENKINISHEEDTAIFPTWKENFQDLSGWCMDMFQGQCDFPIGESAATKLSGTKYEGNSVSTLGEGGSKNLISAKDEEGWNVKMNSAEDTESALNNCHSLQPTPQPTSNYEKQLSSAEANETTLWLRLPKRNIAATSTATRSKQNVKNDSAPFHHGYHIGYLDLDDACPTSSIDSAESQHETWDVLRTVETTGSDKFDLLSYLCDDDMRSPDDSISVDMSPVSKSRPSTKSLPIVTQNPAKVKTENKMETILRKVETRSTSTGMSSALDTSVISSRRSERTKSLATRKGEKKYYTEKHDRNDKKRHIEEDSNSQNSDFSYRESREKNNEASRKSRMNKKAKETEMSLRAIELEKDNRILKMKVEELEKLVTSMRNALLRSALKKEC